MLNVSVVIPTCNRPDDLSKTMDSVLGQTVPPNEVIIVDDSEADDTSRLIKNREKEFRIKNISLIYICKNEKSASISRNIGIRNSTGDVVLFFDDDSILDKNYIEEILKVYKERPNAVGVQGYITNRRKSKLKNIVNRVFFLVHSRKNLNLLLPSMQNVYADPLDKIINCQWMVSNNFSFKKEILIEFRFDEDIKNVPDGEDTDISYRIYKKYPSGLYQTPFARLIHKGSEDIHTRSAKLMVLLQVYHTYLFYKDIEQNFRNKLIFLWSRAGLLLLSLVATILRLPESKALRPLCLIHSYAFCFRWLNKIKQGDLEFFNKILK